MEVGEYRRLERVAAARVRHLAPWHREEVIADAISHAVITDRPGRNASLTTWVARHAVWRLRRPRRVAMPMQETPARDDTELAELLEFVAVASERRIAEELHCSLYMARRIKDECEKNPGLTILDGTLQ